MKKILSVTAILFAVSSTTFAQENEGGLHHIKVPAVVKHANMKKYPESKTHHITWETEKGNYEANWGGKDGEANSVTYTPAGTFVEIVKEIESNHSMPENFTILLMNENLNKDGKFIYAKIVLQFKFPLLQISSNFCL